MSGECIGENNKDNIQELRTKFRLLEKDVAHLQNNIKTLEENMVKSEALHEIQLEINTLKNSIEGLRIDREEDRIEIAKLSSAISEIMCRLEENSVTNAEMLGHQIVTNGKQEQFEKTLDSVVNKLEKMDEKIDRRLEKMDKKIDESNIIEQIKKFYGKNKVNKWICRMIGILIMLFIVSVFSFFFSDGDSFVEVIKGLKEWF